MPDEEILHRLEPALVERLGIELDDPRAKALRDAVHREDPDLVRILHGIHPPVRRTHRDTEQTHDRLHAEGGAGVLRGLAILPGRKVGRAILPVREVNRNRDAFPNLVEAVGEERGIGVDFPDLAFPKVVQFEPFRCHAAYWVCASLRAAPRVHRRPSAAAPARLAGAAARPLSVEDPSR